MKGLRLYKYEKLCGVNSIDALFGPGARRGDAVHSVMAYPWRAVWRQAPEREGRCSRFLISVPKKRVRHAVDRVTMRRRCREAYRLNRALIQSLPVGADIAFVYVADTLADYHRTERSVRRILSAINSHK